MDTSRLKASLETYVPKQSRNSHYHSGRHRATRSTNESYSLVCSDIFASHITFTANRNRQHVATLRPRRLRSGYNFTTTDGRFTFLPQSPTNLFGTAVRHDDDTAEAVIRPTRDGVVAIDIADITYIVYSSHDAFLAVDRIQSSRSSSVTSVRVGAVHATRQSSSRMVRKLSPLTFNIVEKVCPVLIPLLAIIIRERAAATARTAVSSSGKHGGSAVVLMAPVVAVTSAIGATVC